MGSTRDLAALLAFGFLVLAGCSDDAVVEENVMPAGNGVCLSTAQIDKTQILNDSAILFFMKDGKTYVNTLPIPCSSLAMEDGFAYLNDVPEVCSNSQTIRVLRSGSFCELGQFTPFQVPKMPDAAPKR